MARCEKPGHTRQTWGGMAWSPCLACKREECFEEAGFARGLHVGKVVGAAIIAWAEVLRKNAPRVVERRYWTSEIDGERFYDCPCPRCGVLMKGRTAGEDEGTDYEWCGSCRY